MQSFTLRPADWEDLPAFKHIVCTTLTEDIPALFDPNKLLEDKKIGFEYIMAAEQNGEVVGFCCRYACRDADTPVLRGNFLAVCPSESAAQRYWSRLCRGRPRHPLHQRL